MMQIVSGLFDHMVLQRNSAGKSDALVTGTATVAGIVSATVRSGSRAIAGFSSRAVGKAAKGAFSVRLAGIPAGGPYIITLSIGSGSDGHSITIKDVLVGDVWIAAGQSNMEGCGRIVDAAKPHPMARAFYMDDHWGVARDPINCLADSVDEVHTLINNNTRPGRNVHAGTGPSVAFAQEMFRITGVPQGVLACAHGGSSMAQWDPAKKNEGSRSLYGATLRRVAKNGGKVAGIIWYQGESEANPDAMQVYTPKMKELIGAFRRDFKCPGLPFVLVQIGRLAASWGNDVPWNGIQEQQRLLPTLIKNTATVPSIDLTLDDLIHISGKDQQRVGRRLAHAMASLNGSSKSVQPPIALKATKLSRNPISGNADITVEFDHVVGRLQAVPRPMGFSLVDATGQSWLYAAELEDNRVLLHATIPMHEMADKLLQFGRGLDPACNITDSADRSLPVFGPLPVAKPRAISAFPKTMEISVLQPSAGKLHSLHYPKDQTSLQFSKHTFSDKFTHIRDQLAALAPKDVLVYFRLPIQCDEPMELAILLGYDGPVKLWVDGGELFHDPNGTNPAVVDARTIPAQLSAGQHELLIALGSNNGNAWGVFLRVERKDVPVKTLKKGPGHYSMPTF